MQKLTEKQSQILQFIEETLNQDGRPPTLRDIAKHFGYSAIGTVEDHIKALKRKGYLDHEPNIACGIRPIHRAASSSIPILGAVPAGSPIEAIQSTLGFLSFTQKLNTPSTTTHKKERKGELYALRVIGESMVGAGIFPDDFVVVRQQDSAENGEIVVALIDGEATVKFLEKRGGRVRLLPANPKYHPIELDPARENSIQGKVVAVQRYYRD